MLITYEEYTAMMGNAEADREKTEAALDAAGCTGRFCGENTRKSDTSTGPGTGCT